MKRCVIIGGAPIGNYERIRAYLRADDYMIFCDSGLKHKDALGAFPDLIVGDFDSFEGELPDASAVPAAGEISSGAQGETAGTGTQGEMTAPGAHEENSAFVSFREGNTAVSPEENRTPGSFREGNTAISSGGNRAPVSYEGNRAPVSPGESIASGSRSSVNPSGTRKAHPEVIELNPVKDDTDTGHAVSVALERGFREFLLCGCLGRRMDHSLGNIYLLHRLSEIGAKALMVDDYSELFMIKAGETVRLDDSLQYFSLINITGCARGIDIRGAKFPLEGAEILQTANDLGISNEVPKGQTVTVSLREGKLLVIRDFEG